MEKNKYTSEILLDVKALVTLFAGFSYREIAKIFSNYFKSINLYRFCLIKYWNNLYYNQIYIDQNILKIRKITGSYKDSNTPNIFKLKTFLNYTIILITQFGPTILWLYQALMGFDLEIIKLSIIYEWHSDVFLFTLDIHIYIVKRCTQWVN